MVGLFVGTLHMYVGLQPNGAAVQESRHKKMVCCNTVNEKKIAVNVQLSEMQRYLDRCVGLDLTRSTATCLDSWTAIMLSEAVWDEYSDIQIYSNIFRRIYSFV